MQRKLIHEVMSFLEWSFEDFGEKADEFSHEGEQRRNRSETVEKSQSYKNFKNLGSNPMKFVKVMAVYVRATFLLAKRSKIIKIPGQSNPNFDSLRKISIKVKNPYKF